MPNDYPPPSYLRCCDGRYGRLFYNVNDIWIGRSLALYGEYSQGEIDLWRQIVQPGMTALDVGANIGAHTLALARLVGETGTVLAFEPQRLLFHLLCANMAVNGIENVGCWLAALGSEPSRTRVPLLDMNAEQPFGSYRVGSHDEGDNIAVCVIDDLGLERCDFVKIDVEGTEEEVIEGARQTLVRFRPVLYVENDDKRESLIALIRSFGYRCFWHLPALFNPANRLHNAENEFPNVASFNMLCLPEGSSLVYPAQFEALPQGEAAV